MLPFSTTPRFFLHPPKRERNSGRAQTPQQEACFSDAAGCYPQASKASTHNFLISSSVVIKKKTKSRWTFPQHSKFLNKRASGNLYVLLNSRKVSERCLSFGRSSSALVLGPSGPSSPDFPDDPKAKGLRSRVSPNFRALAPTEVERFWAVVFGFLSGLGPWHQERFPVTRVGRRPKGQKTGIKWGQHGPLSLDFAVGSKARAESECLPQFWHFSPTWC